MMHTSYFANHKAFPANAVPISICLNPPHWYHGLQYKSVAPSLDILAEYKRDTLDEAAYEKRFFNEVLDKLNPHEVYEEICRIAKGHDAVLLCFEVAGEFCHRHLVAKWLSSYGYEIKELKKPVKPDNQMSLFSLD